MSNIDGLMGAGNPECPVCKDEMKLQGLQYVSACGFSAPEEIAKGFKSKDVISPINSLLDLFGGKYDTYNE